MANDWKRGFDNSSSTTCVIDSCLTIVYCNPAWDSFALQSDGDRATSIYIVGRSYLAYLPEVLIPYYHRLITRAVNDRTVGGEDYECCSSTNYFRYRLTLLPIPGTKLLAMVHSLLIARPVMRRASKSCAYHAGPGGVVTMCAQCRRTRNNCNQRWDWVPDFVKTQPLRITTESAPTA